MLEGFLLSPSPVLKDAKERQRDRLRHDAATIAPTKQRCKKLVNFMSHLRSESRVITRIWTMVENAAPTRGGNRVFVAPTRGENRVVVHGQQDVNFRGESRVIIGNRHLVKTIASVRGGTRFLKLHSAVATVW